MAKEVKLIVEIDEKAKIHVQSEGTQGTECIDLMNFLSKIPGFKITETVKNDDFKSKKVQTTGTTKVGK